MNWKLVRAKLMNWVRHYHLDYFLDECCFCWDPLNYLISNLWGVKSRNPFGSDSIIAVYDLSRFCSLSIKYRYAIYFYPFVDLQFFQLYNAYVLYRLSQDPQCKEWQVGHHYQTLNHTILRLGGIKLISL